MGKEIERKFRVADERWRQNAEQGLWFRQGYLATQGSITVRVRRVGDWAFLTLKGPPKGGARDEFEYRIPVREAEQMLEALCERPFIEKTRYALEYGGHTWEVDVFAGENAGLVMAEVELSRPDEPVQLPPWIGREVTDDPKYLNVNLVKLPYCDWPAQER